MIDSGWPPAYARAAGTDGPIVVLTFRSSGAELEALSSVGHPFFRPPWAPNVVGMVLEPDADWDEVTELVTESYCVLAPQRLVALVERPDEAASAPAAEGRRLDPVLAGRRAEAATGVLGHVEEHAGAVAGRAGAEPVGLTGTDDAGQALGADRRPHRDQRGIDGVVVQPPPAVLLAQVGVRRVGGEQLVELGRRGVEVAVGRARRRPPAAAVRAPRTPAHRRPTSWATDGGSTARTRAIAGSASADASPSSALTSSTAARTPASS